MRLVTSFVYNISTSLRSRVRFVADEGVDYQIIKSLRIHGHDVIYMAETSRGSLDDAILALSNLDNRLLVTRDKDFGELVFRDKMIHSGIRHGWY